MTTPGVVAQGRKLLLVGPVADLVVISDQAVEVSRNRTASLTFTLQPGASVNERAVLTYMVNPDPRAVEAYLTVAVNGRTIRRHNFGSGAHRGMWEVVDGRGLLRGGKNTLEFTAAELPVSVSDVVLWFHRQVQ